MYVGVYMYVCMYMRVCVCVYICIHLFYRLFFFNVGLLTSHHIGVCLDDICFMVILLNNKSHVIL